jgi:hypothetical protein
MRRLILAAAAWAVCFTPALSQQQPPTPTIGELLRAVSVSAPLLQKVTNRDNQLPRLRIAGRFDVRNSSEWVVADIEVKCSWIAESGRILGTFDVVLSSIFPARGSRGQSGETGEREAPEQTAAVGCVPNSLRIMSWTPPPPPPPAVAEGPAPGITAGPNYRPSCPLSLCPDRAEILPTCDCDLKETLVAFEPNPLYLRPTPPSSPEARRYINEMRRR